MLRCVPAIDLCSQQYKKSPQIATLKADVLITEVILS